MLILDNFYITCIIFCYSYTHTVILSFLRLYLHVFSMNWYTFDVLKFDYVLLYIANIFLSMILYYSAKCYISTLVNFAMYWHTATCTLMFWLNSYVLTLTLAFILHFKHVYWSSIVILLFCRHPMFCFWLVLWCTIVMFYLLLDMLRACDGVEHWCWIQCGHGATNGRGVEFCIIIMFAMLPWQDVFVIVVILSTMRYASSA